MCKARQQLPSKTKLFLNKIQDSLKARAKQSSEIDDGYFFLNGDVGLTEKYYQNNLNPFPLIEIYSSPAVHIALC